MISSRFCSMNSWKDCTSAPACSPEKPASIRLSALTVSMVCLVGAADVYQRLTELGIPGEWQGGVFEQAPLGPVDGLRGTVLALRSPRRAASTAASGSVAATRSETRSWSEAPPGGIFDGLTVRGGVSWRSRRGEAGWPARKACPDRGRPCSPGRAASRRRSLGFAPMSRIRKARSR